MSVKDKQLADDIFQDTFIKVIKTRVAQVPNIAGTYSSLGGT
jgi:DNA-directed RNA polymerase specialized sigma24 family protein